MKYEPRFYLDNSKLKETFVIMAVTTDDGNGQSGRLKYSTGLKIAPKDWPKDPKELKDLKSAPLRNMIADLKTLVNNYKILYKVSRYLPIPKEQIKSDLDAKYGRIAKAPKAQVNNGSFDHDTAKILELLKAGTIKNPKTGIPYADNTILSLNNTREALLIFQRETGTSVSFEDTTEDVFNQFINYANEKEYRLSSLNTIIGNWKSLATHARNTLKVNTNEWFDNKRFILPLAKISGKVALSDEEIQKLIDLELTGNDAIIRDRYIVNCDNALRISDMSRFTEAENEGINMVTQKKDKEIAQPLTARTKAILAKYGGKLPESDNANYINKRLKVLCKKAGIDETIIFTEVVGGKLVTQKKKKWEVISNHTARRTGITNMRKAGIDTLDMDHMVAATPSTIRRYDKATAKDTAKKVKSNPYFKS